MYNTDLCVGDTLKIGDVIIELVVKSGRNVRLAISDPSKVQIKKSKRSSASVVKQQEATHVTNSCRSE